VQLASQSLPFRFPDIGQSLPRHRRARQTG
jgi:hypothetical protein